MSIRVGVRIPNSGELPSRLGIAEMARRAERAGVDSVWAADHVAMPAQVLSRYPFSRDGRITWTPDTPWYDPVVALSMMAAVTTRVELGVAVLVLPLRHPVIFAKQAASIDRLSRGRLALGVGAGWLAEEFQILGVPFESRGARLDEWIALLRSCWTGTPAAFEGRHYRLPPDTLCYPTPSHRIPILVGGMSEAAIRRAGRIGDGWLALQPAAELDEAKLASSLARIQDEAARTRRDQAPARALLRVTGSAGKAGAVSAALPALAAAGISEVIVDVDWENGDEPGPSVEVLRAALVA